MIGGGIAGLSAALEASAAGRQVLVLDANSVGGGHAVKAGGFALVGTPLQEQKGHRDGPAIAERDLLAWGEDADAGWVGRYVRASRTEVHDWLAGFGVRFGFILDTPQHSVPRFHFANGAALNVVVPLMRAAFADDRIAFRFNTEAVALLESGGVVTGVRARDRRTGTISVLRTPAVIIATGGFQGDVGVVRREWGARLPEPARLYSGAGHYATGAGIDLAVAAGAATTRMDHQAIFTAGVPDPRDPDGGTALLAQNPAAIWVDSTGHRFVNERAPSKDADDAALKLDPATHWLVFDADGLRTLRVRGTVWLGNAAGIEPLKDAGRILEAGTPAALAAAMGVPGSELAATLQRWNSGVASGNDADFGRFVPGQPDRTARPIVKPPFHAIQLFPLTRKSLGGLAVDDGTRVLDESGRPIPGLYAAGEVTGVAGINGSHGGEGTFLGPSVWMGRLAGRAAAGAGVDADVAPPMAVSALPAPVVTADAAYRAKAVTVPPESLAALVGAGRPGYWHFEASHAIVAERNLDCTACHTGEWPTREARSAAERQVQVASCGKCH